MDDKLEKIRHPAPSSKVFDGFLTLWLGNALRLTTIRIQRLVNSLKRGEAKI